MLLQQLKGKKRGMGRCQRMQWEGALWHDAAHQRKSQIGSKIFLWIGLDAF